MKHDLVAHCGALGDFASFAFWRVLFLLGFVVQYTPTRSSRVQKIASACEVSLANSFFPAVSRIAHRWISLWIVGWRVRCILSLCRHRMSLRSAGLLTDISSFLVVCIKARNGAEKIFH